MSSLFNNPLPLLCRWGYALAAQLGVLIRVGTERTTDVVLQRKVVLLNVSALVAMVCLVIYAGIYVPRGVWGLTASSLLQLVAAVCYVAVWSLNRSGKVLLARIYFFSVSLLMILGNILVGQGSLLLSHYVFLLLGIVTFTFFKRSEWRVSISLMALNVALFLFFEIYDWPAHPSVLAMSPESIKLIRVVKVGTCVVVMLFVMLLTEVMMAQYVAQLDMLGRIDVLTGLPNRRWFLSTLTHALAKSQRMGTSVAVALVDVDHFKRINDEEGHSVGDDALKHLAAQLSAHARAGDFVARMGGEEFMLLMQVDNAVDAEMGAERVRAGVAASSFLSPSGPRRITISVGVALYSPGVMPNRLLRAADLAMYRAKREGRNLVCMVEAQTLNTLPMGAAHA